MISIRLRHFIFLIGFTTLVQSAQALDFKEALTRLGEHQRVRGTESAAKATQEMATQQGAWGDPMLSLSAQNLPSDTFRLREEPMSGFEVMISQRIPITPKYRHQREVQLSRANTLTLQSKQQQRELRRELWQVAIDQERLEKELNIAQESLDWVSQMLQVSRKLYANGQISQQALFDVQIRESELEATIQKTKAEQKKLASRLTYLVGKEQEAISLSSVPWALLEQDSQLDFDYNQASKEMALEAQEKQVLAQRLNRIPDVTLSASYMFRDMPDMADMVSVGVSLPLPLGQRSHASVREALSNKVRAEIELSDFNNQKRSSLEQISSELIGVTEELKILQNRTINYARNSREISGTSYTHGRATYFELLNSEIRLQGVLSREAYLEAQAKRLKLERLFVAGGSLQ